MTFPSDWDSFLQAHPDAHLLQTSAWSQVKHRFGWTAETVRAGETGAMVLFRQLPFGLRIGYLPMGPVPADTASLPRLLPALDALCRRRNAVFLKVEPDWADTPSAREALLQAGFQPSAQHIQPPRTILIDLTGTEEQVFGRMKSKTRYAVRSSEKRGVRMEISEDVSVFYRMMQSTSQRDEFAIHSEAYFQTLFATFRPHEDMEMFLAIYEGEPIAGVIVFTRGHRAWYLYGASVDAHRDLMAPRLLQWESIRWAHARGCTEYDMWGIPDFDEPELEAQFDRRSDGLWSLYRYKRGFGGRVFRFVGAHDRPYQPALYAAYKLYMGLRARHAG